MEGPGGRAPSWNPSQQAVTPQRAGSTEADGDPSRHADPPTDMVSLSLSTPWARQPGEGEITVAERETSHGSKHWLQAPRQI